MKKVLFIDRDGTLITEKPPTYQIDAFEKVEFYPKVFYYLAKIAEELDYKLVMVSNQDGLGTDSFPEENHIPIQKFILQAFENEGITFDKIHIDKTFPEENSPNRKPGTGMLTEYFSQNYDLENSFVIGDRITDVMLAKNLGSKAIWLANNEDLGSEELTHQQIEDLDNTTALKTNNWKDIYEFLKLPQREVLVERKTKETDITVKLNLDGRGQTDVSTGLSFFDHMLEQLGRHSGIDLVIFAKGDLEIDEHHTIEDTAITVGEAFGKALGNKIGIERYGFHLPMDDVKTEVAIDFSGRSWLVWQADFKREMVGDMPTEMFEHFFKSFSDAAKCNLFIKSEGKNEHHKIESIFKALAKSIKMALHRNPNYMYLPSTKGKL